jgi:hypothetical protein
MLKQNSISSNRRRRKVLEATAGSSDGFLPSLKLGEGTSRLPIIAFNVSDPSLSQPICTSPSCTSSSSPIRPQQGNASAADLFTKKVRFFGVRWLGCGFKLNF